MRGRDSVRSRRHTVALAAILLIPGLASCGSGTAVEAVDGTPPVEVPSPSPSAIPARISVNPAAFDRRGDTERLDCTGHRSQGVYDYAALPTRAAEPTTEREPDTPEGIAARWTQRETEQSARAWGEPTVRFTYDAGRGRARRVIIDFVSSSGAVFTSLSASRDRGPHWRLHTSYACAYNPDYTADNRDAFVHLDTGPRDTP